MGHHSLKFQNISFSYPGSEADLIRNFSADLARGWTGIIGPNGSGKTRLLKLATNVLVPDAGLHIRAYPVLPAADGHSTGQFP